MDNIRRLAAGGAVATLLVTGAAIPAQAKDGDVIRRGDCTAGTDWKLKVSPEDGRLEVEGEIDSNRSGERWRWRLKHNGTLSARGVSYTAGPSGSFEVRRLMVDLAGTDTVVIRARRPATGEICRGVVRF